MATERTFDCGEMDDPGAGRARIDGLRTRRSKARVELIEAERGEGDWPGQQQDFGHAGKNPGTALGPCGKAFDYTLTRMRAGTRVRFRASD